MPAHSRAEAIRHIDTDTDTVKNTDVDTDTDRDNTRKTPAMEIGLYAPAHSRALVMCEVYPRQ